MKKDYGKYLGMALMFGFGAIAIWRWQQSHYLFFLLLALRDFLAAIFFLKRKKSSFESNVPIKLLSYISAALPLFYQVGNENIPSLEILLTANLLTICGFLLVTLATIDLGTSMGISPARRGLVKSGIYRYIKHPMYLGYVISESGFLFWGMDNFILFLFSVSLYFLRGLGEKKQLQMN